MQNKFRFCDVRSEYCVSLCQEHIIPSTISRISYVTPFFTFLFSLCWFSLSSITTFADRVFSEVEEILPSLPWDSLPAALRFILTSAPPDTAIRVIRSSVPFDQTPTQPGFVLSHISSLYIFSFASVSYLPLTCIAPLQEQDIWSGVSGAGAPLPEQGPETVAGCPGRLREALHPGLLHPGSFVPGGGAAEEGAGCGEETCEEREPHQITARGTPDL